MCLVMIWPAEGAAGTGGVFAYTEITAARRTAACLGSWEYRLAWEGDYAPTWVANGDMPKGEAEVWADMEDALLYVNVMYKF